MRNLLFYLMILMCSTASGAGIDVSDRAIKGSFPIVGKDQFAEIIVSDGSPQVIRKAAELFSDDVWRVTGKRLDIKGSVSSKTFPIIVGVLGESPVIDKLAKAGKINTKDIVGRWEKYGISVVSNPMNGISQALVVYGSDRRGTAYGLMELSGSIGVSPWYWWADVPVRRHECLYIRADVVSKQPSVKYRGIFINDEDWGMKPWASDNYEKELGDIGPKTYAKVCELILRLKGNMLAPAMHSCSGAFYSHPESKLVADSFGIVITTSHCEPLLINNAAKSEWDVKKDGDWNYLTNKDAIVKKWDERLAEASCFENIYTTAMRGLHDAGLRGDIPMEKKVPLIERVISDQRMLLEKHKGVKAEEIPQIFVPYKETMDIYENGLKVPEDITLVWVDDNYGYMKRVSDPSERKREGGAGVYYHLSYLGAPHDYLWLNTTPPVLMYEELKKAYDTGADRYWLLNVGDIKPMELGMTTFFDMAWDLDSFNIDNVNGHQSSMLSEIFGEKYREDFQEILDRYYQLAWSRKPEFMGWEREWDKPEYTGLKDTEYSFENYNEAQRRIAGYKRISDLVSSISSEIDPTLNPAFFELIEYPVKGATQMNRKFLMAQLNHEMHKKGKVSQANWAANQSQSAYDSINTLNTIYNGQLNWKWNGMMKLAPGWCAQYQKMPDVFRSASGGETAVDISYDARKDSLEKCHVVDLRKYSYINGGGRQDIRLVDGIGYDWHVIQLGDPIDEPEDPSDINGPRIEYEIPAIDSESVEITLYTVPFFPLYKGRGTKIGISVDGSQPTIYDNDFKEYSLEWKDQVLKNSDEVKFRFNIDKSLRKHKLSFICGDPGMMIQKVVVDWGGLKPSYIGPVSIK